MTNIHFEPHRQGMTVLPDQIDQVTGERIEGTSQVVDTRIANWANNPPVDNDSDLIEEAIAEDPEHPDYVSEEVRMADTHEDVLTAAETNFDEALATTVSAIDMGNTPADITVQHLVTQYYLGNISRDEAFHEAIQSGIAPDKLMQSYWKLKHHFE